MHILKPLYFSSSSFQHTRFLKTCIFAAVNLLEYSESQISSQQKHPSSSWGETFRPLPLGAHGALFGVDVAASEICSLHCTWGGWLGWCLWMFGELIDSEGCMTVNSLWLIWLWLQRIQLLLGWFHITNIINLSDSYFTDSCRFIDESTSLWPDYHDAWVCWLKLLTEGCSKTIVCYKNWPVFPADNDIITSCHIHPWNFKHGTWKSVPGKGDSYWKPSFSGSMLNFGRG